MIDIFSDVPPFARKSVIFKCTSWIMEQFPNQIRFTSSSVLRALSLFVDDRLEHIRKVANVCKDEYHLAEAS